MKLDNKVKTAFEQIHADHSLKDKTKEAVYRRTNGFSHKRSTRVRKFVAVTACALTLMLGLGGYFSYTIPVAAVSIDMNPSIELEINIYDRVIDTKGYNDDGIALENELSVNNLNYTDAINSILENESIASSSDELLEITVASGSQKKAERMRNCICDETSIAPAAVYCLKNADEVAAAHSAGISLGKYRAYLQLHEINPNITTDDIRDLTMREIRELIEQESSDTTQGGQSENGHGNGNGNGHGYGK